MEEINLKDFFSYLKHYIWAFILVTALAVTGVAFYDSVIKKPIYQASTTIVIAKSSDGASNSTTTLNDVNASQKLTTTYSEIAKSELVLNQVVKRLDLPMTGKELSKNVTVKPVEDTSILNVQVKDLDPKEAARITNEIAEVFTKQITEIYKLDNVSQLSVAEIPLAPANNTLTRDLILAMVIAVFGVAGIAFLRFYLDDSVKHGDDIEKTFGLSTAGQISENSSRDKKNIKTKNSKGKKIQEELIVEKSPKAIASENVKSLRTNLQFTAIDKDIKTILVTSTNPGEGKSFVAANLAISFAQADKKVLLVDCDLRKGRVHRLFEALNLRGLSNLLTDDIKNVNEYIRTTSIHNLDVIPCGIYPPNPSELLASKKNKRLINMLRSRYDIVIFDGAPVNGLADSVILAGLVDETLVVVKDGATSKNDLMVVRDELNKVGARVAGVVFNFVKRRSSHYYYYEEDGTKTQRKHKNKKHHD